MAPRAASPLIGQPPALRELPASEFADGPGPGALYRGSPGPWWRAATLPVSIAALAGPVVALLTPWALAPLLGLALLLAVPGHWREQRALPFAPFGAALVPLALAGWAGLSALWAPDPGRALASVGVLAAAALLGGLGAAVVAEDRPAARRALGACVALGLGGGLALALSGLASAATMPGPGPAAGLIALLPPLMLRLRLAGPWRWLLLALATGGALLLPDEAAGLAALAGAGAALLVGLGGRFVSALLALLLAGAVMATPVLLPRAMPDRVPGASPAELQRLLTWDFALEQARRLPLTGWGAEASHNLPGAHASPTPESLARLGIPAEARNQLLAAGAERMPTHPQNAAVQIFLELGWIGLGLAALAVLALGWGAGAAGAGVLAAAAAMSLAVGAWEPWWLAAQAFAGAVAAGLSARRV
ncbi:O-antigen ligase family protein [Pararoseomonas indoligenes]|uniref:O-antigen ligase-related domain-containing protein n=1 Tax=Roseomonas indoligenes TaxID=2820811 RepID=A0A940S6W8_9PROT|nr:O-antigen ligase family protein [Pararoseomonas indoligenes]MBP0495986.1 hypothetical protein [Pararoseomonas indoligenes]